MMKCYGCNNDITDNYHTATIGDFMGKPICDHCWLNDLSNPIGAVTWHSGYSSANFFIGKHNIHGLDSQPTPENHKEVYQFASKGSIDGWSEMVEGWFGKLAGHNPYGDLVKFYNKWTDGKNKPMFKIMVVFMETEKDNVSRIKVFVDDNNKEQFFKWLETGT